MLISDEIVYAVVTGLTFAISALWARQVRMERRFDARESASATIIADLNKFIRETLTDLVESSNARWERARDELRNARKAMQDATAALRANRCPRQEPQPHDLRTTEPDSNDGLSTDRHDKPTAVLNQGYSPCA